MSDWHVAANPRSFTHRNLVSCWLACLVHSSRAPVAACGLSLRIFADPQTQRPMHIFQCHFLLREYANSYNTTACRLCLMSTLVQGCSVLLAARLVKQKRPQQFTQANAGWSSELHGEFGLGDRLTSPRNQGEQRAAHQATEVSSCVCRRAGQTEFQFCLCGQRCVIYKA